MKQRNIFHSKVFWGAVLSAIAGITPVAKDAIKAHDFTADDGASIVLILVSVGTTVLAKIDENEERSFTPDFLPGPNKLQEETSN